jgi:hypothetical protein
MRLTSWVFRIDIILGEIAFFGIISKHQAASKKPIQCHISSRISGFVRVYELGSMSAAARADFACGHIIAFRTSMAGVRLFNVHNTEPFRDRAGQSLCEGLLWFNLLKRRSAGFQPIHHRSSAVAHLCCSPGIGSPDRPGAHQSNIPEVTIGTYT